MKAGRGETERTEAPAAFSTLWVAKLIPLFAGFDPARLEKSLDALERRVRRGEIGDTGSLLDFLANRVLPELAKEELAMAVLAWELAGGEREAVLEREAPPPAGPHVRLFHRTALIRAAVEARELGAPCEAFLAALLYDRVARCVSRAAGLMALGRNSCRELIASTLAKSAGLVAAARRTHSLPSMA